MKMTKRSFSMLLSASLAISVVPAASAAPVTSYTDFQFSPANLTPVKALKPAWTIETDLSTAIVSGDLVVYPKKDKLYAADAATGRNKWTASFKPASEVTVDSGKLYFVDSKGQLVGLNAKTGKPLWKTKTGLSVDNNGNSTVTSKLGGGTLYVSGPMAIQAYNPANGKLLWKQKTESKYWGSQIYGTYDGVLVASTTVSGALTVNYYYGYDPKTGKQLWTLGGNHGPLLDYQKGHLYLRDQFPMNDSDHAILLDKVNVKTGKIAASYQYISVQDSMFQRVDQAVIDGDYLYIAMRKYTKDTLQGYSSVVYRYKLDQDPDKQKPTTYEDRGDFLAGPYMDRFFVQDGLQLKAVRFDGKMTRTYSMPVNPVSRLDLIGTGAYAGLSDGNFYLLDIATGQTLGSVHAGGRVYGQTLLAGGMVIVQAEGKLIAVKRPAALKN